MKIFFAIPFFGHPVQTTHMVLAPGQNICWMTQKISLRQEFQLRPEISLGSENLIKVRAFEK